jgi:AraC-like DNA-binding protein
MEIYKDLSTLSGFRLEVPPNVDFPFSHIGEYLSSREMVVYPHHHLSWELLLLIEGETSWRQESREISLHAGELLLCPPHVRHSKRRREAANYRFYFLGCKMDEDLWPVLRPHLPLGRMTTLAHAHELALNFRMAEEELLFARARQKEGVELAWKQLWLAVYRLFADRELPVARDTKWLSRRVGTLVESNPGEAWTVPTVAKFMGYSPTHFAKLFHEQAGLSFHQYLLTVRMDAGKRALERGAETVTEIALRLGFSSSQHFSSAFTGRAGMAPLRWKRERATRPAKQPSSQGFGRQP